MCLVSDNLFPKHSIAENNKTASFLNASILYIFFLLKMENKTICTIAYLILNYDDYDCRARVV